MDSKGSGTVDNLCQPDSSKSYPIELRGILRFLQVDRNYFSIFTTYSNPDFIIIPYSPLVQLAMPNPTYTLENQLKLSDEDVQRIAKVLKELK